MRCGMNTELELAKIDAANLEQVQGGSRTTSSSGGVDPMDPFGVVKFWTNAWGAAVNFTPPFSTTPLIPHPFE